MIKEGHSVMVIKCKDNNIFPFFKKKPHVHVIFKQ